MRLTTLSDNTLLVEQHMQSSRNILRESCDGLTSQQRYVVEGVYRELIPLIEATLTADQVKQIFGQVEKQSIAGGQSRSAIGHGVDAAKEVNKVIDNVGKWLQNTTPVKAFDQKFEDLKNKINKKFPDSKLLDAISEMGMWAQENPGKTAAIIGVLTALASLAGGPVGGAIAGQVLRGATELLKGEKLSTAIGKGIKTAALGYLSGKAFEMIGKFVGGMRADSLPVPGAEESGLASVNYGATKTITGFGTEYKQTIQGFNVTVFPQEAEGINNAMAMIKSGQPGGFDALQKIAQEIRSPEYKSAIKDIIANARADQLSNDGLLSWINGMSKAGQALSQGAVAASGEKKESYYIQDRPLSEGQVYMLFNRVLTEAGFLDKAKELGGKALGAVAKGADWVGKQATETITSAKLLASWKMSGSPLDSEELKKFLITNGVDAGIVDKVYTDMKLGTEPAASSETPADAAKPASYKDIKKAILALNKKDRSRMLQYVQKQLGTV